MAPLAIHTEIPQTFDPGRATPTAVPVSHISAILIHAVVTASYTILL